MVVCASARHKQPRSSAVVILYRMHRGGDRPKAKCEAKTKGEGRSGHMTVMGRGTPRADEGGQNIIIEHWDYCAADPSLSPSS